MTEFVEDAIEALIPALENLKFLQLLSKSEIGEFTKRCRDFEYRVSKLRRTMRDYMVYVDHLQNFLKLLRLRRQRAKCNAKYNEIEDIFKAKIADLYRRCCEQYQGNRDIWCKRLEFLKNQKMNARCSRAFVRAMQIFPDSITIRIDAARWEFTKNGSVDNSRLILQTGLRIDEGAVSLWLTHFELELKNAKRLWNRRSVLTREKLLNATEIRLKNDKNHSLQALEAPLNTNDENDVVLSLKIVETLVKHALVLVAQSSRNELLLSMWRCAKSFGMMASQLSEQLYELLWSNNYISEYSWFARLEKDNQDISDLYELVDDACKAYPTAIMLRYCINIYERHFNFEGDMTTKQKLRDLLLDFIDKGYAARDDFEKALKIDFDPANREKIVEKALEQFETSPFFWCVYIQVNLEKGVDDESMQKIFNKAGKQVTGEGALGVYQMAIDWAIKNCPSKIDDVFYNAISFAPRAAISELKSVRLKYLSVAYPDDPSYYRREYQKFLLLAPKSMQMYRTYIEIEENCVKLNHDLILEAFEKYVSDFGDCDHECWIDYVKYLIKYDPLQLPIICKRAYATLFDTEAEEFNVRYIELTEDLLSEDMDEYLDVV